MQPEFTNTVLPILVCTAIGLVWTRLKLPFDTASLSALVSNLGIPCLLLSTLDRPGLTLGLLGSMIMAGVLALTCFAALGAAALALLGLPVRRLLPSLMLPNTSNLGLPVALFAFGQEGLLYAVAFSAVVQAAHFTIGVWLVSGKSSPRVIFSSPMIWALAAAALLTATGAHPPPAIIVVTRQLGAIAPPLMLLMLGASLGRIRFPNIGRSILLSLVRVGGGLGVGLGVARLLALPPAAAGAFTLQCAMPVAVLSHLIAQQHDGPAEDIAGMILMSTGLVIVCLPVMLAVLGSVFPH